MSLQNYMTSLSVEHLKILHGDLVDAGIAFDCKGDYKSIFINRRKASSGKRKKIYAALSSAKKADINRMIDTLVTMLPHGFSSK